MPEKSNWKVLADEVIDSLSQNERESSVAYLELRVIPAGEELRWAGIERSFDEPVVIAFVDLQPELNWTHRGRYLVLGANGGVRQKLEVDRPPFLTQVSPRLRVIHQGSQAPDWTLVTLSMESK